MSSPIPPPSASPPLFLPVADARDRLAPIVVRPDGGRNFPTTAPSPLLAVQRQRPGSREESADHLEGATIDKKRRWCSGTHAIADLAHFPPLDAASRRGDRAKSRTQGKSSIGRPAALPEHLLANARRIYGHKRSTGRSSIRATPSRGLDPLQRIQEERARLEKQGTALTLAMEAKLDRVGGKIPLQFLLDHQHHAVAERVVLNTTCTILHRHHRRLQYAALQRWKHRTLMLRILEEQAQQEFVNRQTNLAHACAIIQEKVMARVRKSLRQWYTNALLLRVLEQYRAACPIQRSWRRFSRRRRLQKMAMEYRTLMRHQCAVRIQSQARRYLAKQTVASLVFEHRRHHAAVRIQKCYRNHVVRQLAHRQLRHLATIVIQRYWRGHRGRKRVEWRRQSCRRVVDQTIRFVWIPLAEQNARMKCLKSIRLQRWWRILKNEELVNAGLRRSWMRRHFFPATKIQLAWKAFRGEVMEQIVYVLTLRVTMIHLTAVRRIQTSYRRFKWRQQDRSSHVILRLLREYDAKRRMKDRVLTWLTSWQRLNLTPWIRMVSSSSKWSSTLHNHDDHIHEFQSVQADGARRLQVTRALNFVIQLKQFEQAYVTSRANEIKKAWRRHSIRVLIARLKAATILLQRALPFLFRCYTMRNRRRRVLGRWKRTRFMVLRGCFDHWKHRHLMLVESRGLIASNEKIRRAKWFRHHKLRKAIVVHWIKFVENNRLHRRKHALADQFSRRTTLKRFWTAWIVEALPLLACSNCLNAATLQIIVCARWKTYCDARKGDKKASAHYNNVLLRKLMQVWRLDMLNFQQQMTDASICGDRLQLRAAFSSYRTYVSWMKLMDVHSKRKRKQYAVREWVQKVCLRHQSATWQQKAVKFQRDKSIRMYWDRWILYFRHQKKQLIAMKSAIAFYHTQRLKRLISAWSSVLVPIWKDDRFIKDIAIRFYDRRLKEFCFRAFRLFWALTAGAKRVAMASRIQRAFRSKRARTKLFIMRMKITYELEARFSMGVDVKDFTMDSIAEATKRHEWVFVLVSFPWCPLPKEMKDAFAKAATTWSYLRHDKTIAFGMASATDMINFCPSLGISSTTGPLDPISFLSFLGLTPACIPAIVGVWQGRGPAVDQTSLASFLPGQCLIQLKRRFLAVCTADHCRSIVLPMQPLESAKRNSTSSIVHWVESQKKYAREATAVDIQSIIRGFLSRRHVKRLRVLKREKQAQRIRDWVGRLKEKWLNHRAYSAAVKIQKWVRQVHVRREFWSNLRKEMHYHRDAATRLQRFLRKYFVRRRMLMALVALLATPIRYPNAPLCEECIISTNDARIPALAQLYCRKCTEVFCVNCFVSYHQGGKRLEHHADSIDVTVYTTPNALMCGDCQVRRATKICSTCKPGDGLLLCVTCFEFRHSPLFARTLHCGQTTRRKPWWESSEFLLHQWERLDPTDATLPLSIRLTATEVLRKNGWKCLSDLLVEKQLENDREARENDRQQNILALRYQNEAILRDAFDKYDADKSGSIDRTEFKRMFREELCQPLTDVQADRAMKSMDKSGNGQIEFDELLAWFTEDLLERSRNPTNNESEFASLVLLKEALKAKRKMRRYKEKLNEILPPVSKLLVKSASESSESNEKNHKVFVPGFPSIECLQRHDYARKRRVFFRFLHEICNLDWIFDDEDKIPVSQAMEMFDQLFLPRWNFGLLTYDFYFDEELFQFEGEQWERKWNSSQKRYFYHTTRTKKRVVGEDPVARHGKLPKRRKRGKHHPSEEAQHEIEDIVEIVEAIDPRRRQMLEQSAREAFARADSDGSGYIDSDEFYRMLNSELCEPVSKAKAKDVMKQLDADGSGKIDFHEFFQWYATEKCQDIPLTPQLERARALLRTKKRAKAKVTAALNAGVSTGTTFKEIIDRRLKEQQLARDCKGAPPELIQLLLEGFEKGLAEKALQLHNQDVDFARKWLRDKIEADKQEREEVARIRFEHRQQRQKDAKLRAEKRRQKLSAFRKQVKLVLIGPSKKEAHAARLHQALTNLDREILMVESQLNQKSAKRHS